MLSDPAETRRAAEVGLEVLFVFSCVALLVGINMEVFGWALEEGEMVFESDVGLTVVTESFP